METEIIDKLFLELSQITKAETFKERQLSLKLEKLRKAVGPFAVLIKTTNGRIPTERLSLANWHDLVKAFNETE